MNPHLLSATRRVDLAHRHAARVSKRVVVPAQVDHQVDVEEREANDGQEDEQHVEASDVDHVRRLQIEEALRVVRVTVVLGHEQERYRDNYGECPD